MTQEGTGTEALLATADARCGRRGATLTPLRRQVLRLVLEAQQPVGAYALLERLRDERGSAAPPTVYRALDFLLEHGLIHRVERLNAFIPCVEAAHDRGPAEGHGHAHQFLICTSCGTTVELTDQAVAQALEAASLRAGFRPARATVEVEGLCAACAR